jgi:hypothetical protein
MPHARKFLGARLFLRVADETPPFWCQHDFMLQLGKQLVSDNMSTLHQGFLSGSIHGQAL